jgi:hypothetical protein
MSVKYSLTLKAEHILKVYENKMLKRIIKKGMDYIPEQGASQFVCHLGPMHIKEEK